MMLILSQMFQWYVPARIPSRTTRKPKCDPTEMSNSPAINRNVIPTPTIAQSDTCRVMFRMLSTLKKFLAVMEKAVESAVAERPDFVFMDIRLANDTDGIGAACEILACTGIRCIFASAYADPPTVARGEAARPFGWLRKPFTAEAVVKAANQALGELGKDASAA